MNAIDRPIRRIPDHIPSNLPPRIKVSYPKGMTIGLGFLCSDGVVLGADTQLSVPGSHKTYASKLRNYRDSANWRAISTYAGSPVFMGDFEARFREAMEEAERQTV